MAGSRWYRTFQTRELVRWLRGEYNDARVDVPVRWLTGTKDPPRGKVTVGSHHSHPPKKGKKVKG